MGFVDGVLSNTLGLGYRAVTGNVDPWTLDQQKQDVAASIAQASGPNVDPATLAAAQASAQNEIDKYLYDTHAHPDQSGVRIGGVIGKLLGGGNDGLVIGGPDDNTTALYATLQKYVYGGLVLVAVVGGVYFWRLYGSTLKRAFPKG
jgi:hypothetical protein